jgi:hypothetical protein
MERKIKKLAGYPRVLLLYAPAGWIRISFDVYDQVGNVNLAPNGVHAVFYE